MDRKANPIDLSISLLTWNTKQFLKPCLDSIFSGTKRIGYEVIVVDNGSSDGTAEMLRTEYPRVIHIRNEKNLGFTAGNNQAIRASRGRYVLILNDDTELREGCLDRMVELMDADPRAGAATMKMFYPDGSLYPSIHQRYPTPLCCLCERSFLTELFPASRLVLWLKGLYFILDEREYARDQPIAWGIGAALMVRREAIERVGTLDEGFFIYFEEIDWCRRMRNAGWTIMYYHVPEIIHHTAKSVVQEYERMTIIWHKSRFYFYRKNYGRIRMWLLKLIVVPGIVVRLVKLTWRIAMGDPGGTDRQRAMRGTYLKILVMSLFYPRFGKVYDP